MYRLERIYVQENRLCEECSKAIQFLSGLFEVFRKGVEAARVAESNPEDRETLYRILTRD